MTGRSNGSEKREGGGVGQEGRDAGGRWDTELEDAGYAYVEQVSFSRLKNKKKQKKRTKYHLATNGRCEKWPLIKGRFPELFLQSVYQQRTS